MAHEGVAEIVEAEAADARLLCRVGKIALEHDDRKFEYRPDGKGHRTLVARLREARLAAGLTHVHAPKALKRPQSFFNP